MASKLRTWMRSFRLRPSACEFPPLKVFFNKETTRRTPFGGNGALKLITHCHKAPRYEQNVLVEHGVYRAYNRLTPLSHRSRLARITYLDTADSSRTMTRYGFFLEDDDDVARRNGGKILPMVGGELELDNFDLAYRESTKVYQAPLQLTANGGILIIDDFGRQKCSPVAMLNRWITPLESRIDSWCT